MKFRRRLGEEKFDVLHLNTSFETKRFCATRLCPSLFAGGTARARKFF
jgi:hypothetical protein